MVKYKKVNYWIDSLKFDKYLSLDDSDTEIGRLKVIGEYEYLGHTWLIHYTFGNMSGKMGVSEKETAANAVENEWYKTVDECIDALHKKLKKEKCFSKEDIEKVKNKYKNSYSWFFQSLFPVWLLR